jgi:hypothetical protein
MNERRVPTGRSTDGRVVENQQKEAVHREQAARRSEAAAPPEARARLASEPHAPLFDENEGVGLRSRWEAIQTGFVDEPRVAVEQADALVSQIMTRLTQVFADERTSLERQWSRGDNVSTEDLRLALKRYRSFLERLLSV